MDDAAKKGKELKREKVVFRVCIAITIEALLVAIDGLGASGIFKFWGTDAWNDCFLDFMDCWSEGVAMPLGAMLMAVMVGWELKVTPILEEIDTGSKKSSAFDTFYKVCIKFITPIAMAFIFAGSVSGFFTKAQIGSLNSEMLGYILGAIVLVVFFIVANTGKKERL